MRRAIALVCLILLAACAALPAGAAETEYLLPDGLETVAAAAAGVALPSGLPEHAHIASFSIDNGLISLELDRVIPKLKIMELNYIKAEESTIYSRKNTSSAETHKAGDNSTVLRVLLIWDPKGIAYTQEFDTWSGLLLFSRAGLTETADPDAFPGWASAVRDLEFREDGTLLSETWKLEKEADTFTRTALYDEGGELESFSVSWRAAGYSGYILDAGFSPDGTLTSLRCKNDMTEFTAESLPVSADRGKFANLRDNSIDPYSFDSKLRAAYPVLAESLFGSFSPAMLQPATATDLPATATDLPAPDGESETPDEDPAVPDEPVEEGEATENTRIWLVSCGDYYDPKVYAFASDDPLFILESGKAWPNSRARDINGTPITWPESGSFVTPDFEAPAAQ